MGLQYHRHTVLGAGTEQMSAGERLLHVQWMDDGSIIAIERFADLNAFLGRRERAPPREVVTTPEQDSRNRLADFLLEAFVR